MDVSGVLTSLSGVAPAVALVGGASLSIYVGLKALKWVRSVMLDGNSEFRFNQAELARVSNEADDYMFDRQASRSAYDPSEIRYVSNEEYEANHGYSFATFNYMKSLEAEEMAADRLQDWEENKGWISQEKSRGID